jgi:hypothetical protein
MKGDIMWKNAPESPIKRPLYVVYVYELESGEVWGEMYSAHTGEPTRRGGELVTELTEDSVSQLFDGFAEILEGV